MPGKRFADRATDFYTNLDLPGKLPVGVKVLNPYKEPSVRTYVKRFYDAFYLDTKARIFTFGINPGRFGAGLTGVAFTDPVALERLGILNDLPKKHEPSSDFIHAFIDAWGGPQAFYGDIFLTSVCPLGFTKEGKNYNFYDEPALARAVEPFILASIEAQLKFGAYRETAVVLGKGTLRTYFADLNEKYGFFKEVLYLEHPRYVWQYKRSELTTWFRKYKEAFTKALS